MKTKYELEPEDFDCIHDVCLDAIDENFTNEDILWVFNKVLEEQPDIVSDASYWGWNDTGVRDKLFIFMQNLRKRQLGKNGIMKVIIEDEIGNIHKLSEEEVRELENCIDCTENESQFHNNETGKRLKKLFSQKN